MKPELIPESWVLSSMGLEHRLNDVCCIYLRSSKPAHSRTYALCDTAAFRCDRGQRALFERDREAGRAAAPWTMARASRPAARFIRSRDSLCVATACAIASPAHRASGLHARNAHRYRKCSPRSPLIIPLLSTIGVRERERAPLRQRAVSAQLLAALRLWSACAVESAVPSTLLSPLTLPLSRK